MRARWIDFGVGDSYSEGDLIADARAAMAATPVDWDFSPSSPFPGVRCSLCDGSMFFGTAGSVRIAGGDRFPIHEECHRSRAGLSSEGVMLGMRMGLGFLLAKSMDRNDRRSGQGILPRFFRDFVERQGPEVGSCLVGFGVPWWNRAAGFPDLETFTRWARHSFIHEREAVKFETLGCEVPEWDESRLSWNEYISKGKGAVSKGPFYELLESIPRRRSRGSGPSEAEVRLRTGGCCALCGGAIEDDGREKLAYDGDHIRSFINGGDCSLENFQATHRVCNRAKSNITGGHLPLGLLLGRHAISCFARSDAAEAIPGLLRTCVREVVKAKSQRGST